MNDHKINTDLLDFLAEKFLEQHKSITYTNVGGYPALKVASEEGITTYLPLFAGEISAQFLKDLKQIITIPVVEEEEQGKLEQLLQESKIINIETYRLTFDERYNFYSRKYCLSKIAN